MDIFTSLRLERLRSVFLYELEIYLGAFESLTL